MEKFLEGRMFLQKALEKILSDKDIKRAPELKQCCEEYLELLKSEVLSNKAEINAGYSIQDQKLPNNVQAGGEPNQLRPNS